MTQLVKLQAHSTNLSIKANEYEQANTEVDPESYQIESRQSKSNYNKIQGHIFTGKKTIHRAIVKRLTFKLW